MWPSVIEHFFMKMSALFIWSFVWSGVGQKLIIFVPQQEMTTRQPEQLHPRSLIKDRRSFNTSSHSNEHNFYFRVNQNQIRLIFVDYTYTRGPLT